MKCVYSLVSFIKLKDFEGSTSIMYRIKFMIKQFLKEPLWFKTLISITLLISIIFSSSFFSYNAYYESCSKLAAAIFFCVYGFKLRRNLVTSVILFTLAVICIYLSILAINKWFLYDHFSYYYRNQRKWSL